MVPDHDIARDVRAQRAYHAVTVPLHDLSGWRSMRHIAIVIAAMTLHAATTETWNVLQDFGMPSRKGVYDSCDLLSQPRHLRDKGQRGPSGIPLHFSPSIPTVEESLMPNECDDQGRNEDSQTGRDSKYAHEVR
jgi:hypothetical protein